jgi:hypothetical protein
VSIPLRTAHRAQKYSVRCPAGIECFRWQGIATCIDGAAAKWVLREINPEIEPGLEAGKYVARRRIYLRTNTISRQAGHPV